MERRATIVTDISYGDAGKGTMVDYLVRQASSNLVIRHNGGPQAAHNVVTPDGRHHTFAQFGSGMFVPGTQTHLSQYMLVNPLNMFPEAVHLQQLGVKDVWERISVHEQAPVITPWHQSVNRLRELARGDARHGSTGQGVGEATVDMLLGAEVIRVADLAHPKHLRARLEAIRDAKLRQLRDELEVPDSDEARAAWATFTTPSLVDWLVEQYELWMQLVAVVDTAYVQGMAGQVEQVVCEGAQGVLLDEWFGFFPYNTWSRTTHINALELLQDIGYDAPVTRMGVLRGYMTRHGAGPLVSEKEAYTDKVPDQHNGHNTWQQGFRVGTLDLVAHRYALNVAGGADVLAVTNLDRMQVLPEWHVSNRYQYCGAASDTLDYLSFDAAGLVQDIVPVPVGNWRQPVTRHAELLADCKPVDETVPKSATARELLETIEDRLGLPISVASFGPTATDKRSR